LRKGQSGNEIENYKCSVPKNQESLLTKITGEALGGILGARGQNRRSRWVKRLPAMKKIKVNVKMRLDAKTEREVKRRRLKVPTCRKKKNRRGKTLLKKRDYSIHIERVLE